MANRVLLGNRSTGGYGLYVSDASGSNNDVTNCDKAKLLFWTDSGETGSGFIAKGTNQTVPYSGGTGSTAPVTGSTINLSSNATASQSHQNLGTGTFVYGGTQDGATAASQSTFSKGNFASNQSATGFTLNREGTGATYTVAVFKKLSTSALY